MATSLTQRIVNPNITTSPIVITTPDKEIKGPETMLAATWHGAKDVRADVQPRPHVTDPTDAVVRITTTTICGSDLHLYLNQVPALKPMEKGDILGHEGVGIVEEVGPNVTKFRRGDRVIVSAVIACGQCEYCRKGQFSVCDTTNPSSQAERMMGHRTAALFGYSHITGGFGGLQAEYARVPIADVNLLHLPASVPDEIGVLLSDVACTGWHANELGEVSAGQTVAIWGAGPIGLMAARWAKFRGAQTVISIDNVPQRLQQARTISGVDHTINFDEVSVTERIKELVPGGPDVCIDCAGFRFPKTFLHRVQTLFKLESDALDIVTEMIYAAKKAGKLVLIGDYFGFGNQFPIGAFMEKGCTMRGGQLFCQRYWEKLLEFVTSGQIDLSPFVTSTMTLDQIDEGYKRMIDYDQAVIKIAIKTNAAAPAAQPVQGQPVDLKAAFK